MSGISFGMDTALLIVVWIIIVGVVVALLAWFGPRPSQWRTHKGGKKPTSGSISPDAPGGSDQDTDETQTD